MPNMQQRRERNYCTIKKNCCRTVINGNRSCLRLPERMLHTDKEGVVGGGGEHKKRSLKFYILGKSSIQIVDVCEE